MAETTSNIEFAQHLNAHAVHSAKPGNHRQEWLEIFEAVVLATVAVLTAWSGYQAAKWDAESSEAYALANETMVQAQEQRTLAGQDHLYDVITFDSWLEAWHRNDEYLSGAFERRFRPEFAVAYEAWRKTDPLHNLEAPPGPSFMPEYKSARSEKSSELAKAARAQFETGVATRQTGDEYVRLSVVLATVLLLTALAQRFKIQRVRVGLLGVATVLLVFATFLLVNFPRV